MTMFTRNKKRLKFWRTRPNQWGSGRTHLAVWYPEERCWALLCKENPNFVLGDDLSQGDEVADAPVSCKRCKRKIITEGLTL